MREKVQLLFPTIFCRPLDHIQRFDDHLIVVNDNSVEEDMAIMNLHMGENAMRSNLKDYNIHTEHKLKNIKPL